MDRHPDEQTDPTPVAPTDRPSLRDRLQAAGIPVPPPMTAEQRKQWERQQDEADRLPRIYGPKTAV